MRMRNRALKRLIPKLLPRDQFGTPGYFSTACCVLTANRVGWKVYFRYGLDSKSCFLSLNTAMAILLSLDKIDGGLISVSDR